MNEREGEQVLPSHCQKMPLPEGQKGCSDGILPGIRALALPLPWRRSCRCESGMKNEEDQNSEKRNGCLQKNEEEARQ